MRSKGLETIHPGEILEQEFLLPLGLSANALAKRIDVPVTRISEIVRGRRGITADTALRLSRFFGTSAELWLGLQTEYDLRTARREGGDALERGIIPLKRAEATSTKSQRGASMIRERGPKYGRPMDRRRIRKRS
ncbi:MAG: HigA family addiction module antitoxin [Thermoanaerobaculia bacterium]